MSTDDAIAQRKQQKVLRWAKKERILTLMDEAGVKYRKAADKGPASGIAYLPHKSGEITLRLSSWVWTQGAESGRGWRSLLRKAQS